MKSSYLLNNYKRFELTITKGKGVYAYDLDNKKFLDFTSGIATNVLGHSNKRLNKALCKQSKKIWHTSNIFYNPTAVELSKALCEKSIPGKVFFCNSGTEANETAIKSIRRFWSSQESDRDSQKRFRIITFKGSFHGRTIASISASMNPVHIKGFSPLLEGFDQAEFGDIESVKRLITDNTAAILIEPIQGEGGVNFAGFDFLEKVDKICKENNLLLALDEVQTGVYRTGKFFAYQHSNIRPDTISFAKGIAGGFPLGGCVITDNVAKFMQPGSHGSTFGGNPLACAVSLEVIKITSDKKFLKNLEENIIYLENCLKILHTNFSSSIKEIRGVGFLRGIQLHNGIDITDFLNRCINNGLLLAPAGSNVIRVLPPLISKKYHLEEFLDKLKFVFNKYYL